MKRLVPLALAALLPCMAQAADFRLLPDNPLARECPIDRISGVDRSFAIHAIGGTCPEAGDPITMAQRWAELIDSSRIWFLDDAGAPRIMLDGGNDSIRASVEPATMSSLLQGRVVSLSGEIGTGDAARLEALLLSEGLNDCMLPGYCPFSHVLALDSPGGSLAEALELVRVVQRYQLVTWLPAGSRCASACAFVFFAGFADYEGQFHNRRFAHADARLGLHRPNVPLSDPAYASEQVEALVAMIDRVKADAVRQFVAARVPLQLLEQMYDTAPDDMYHLSPAELGLIATVFEGPWLREAAPSRTGVLAYCGAAADDQTGYVPLDLLATLDLRETSFLAFEKHGEFACYGARLASGSWEGEVCTSGADDYPNFRSSCALIQCLTGPLRGEDTACDEQLALDFAFDFENGGLGVALSGLSGAARHQAVREALKSGIRSPQRGPLPGWVATATPPPSLCGRVDLRAPETARALQQALAARGFDPGPADGRIGPMTEVALHAAHAQLASGLRRDDPAFLRALGLTETQIHEAMLCE